MNWYTGKGDDGETSLYGGGRVAKDDPRIEALGDLDEATSAIGLARAAGTRKASQALLLQIQRHLSTLMAEVATPSGTPTVSTLQSALAFLEEEISKLQVTIAFPRDFIYPGATLSGAHLDFARTVVRRAERRLVRLSHQQPMQSLWAQRYLNRLSSLLFLLARAEEQVG